MPGRFNIVVFAGLRVFFGSESCLGGANERFICRLGETGSDYQAA